MKATEIKKGTKFYIVKNEIITACRVRKAVITLKGNCDGYTFDMNKCPDISMHIECDTPEGMYEINLSKSSSDELHGCNLYESIDDALHNNKIILSVKNEDILVFLEKEGCKPTKCVHKKYGIGGEFGFYKLWTMGRNPISAVLEKIKSFSTDGDVSTLSGRTWYNTKDDCETAEFAKIKVVDFAE